MMGGGNALGALAQLGNQSIGQMISYGMNSAAANKSWDRQKNMMTRGPMYMMQGLKNAGLNPILAVTGGMKPGGARAPQAAPAQKGGPIDINTGSARSLMKSQTSAADALADKNTAEAALARTRAQLEGMDAPRRSALMDFFSTDKGKRILEMMQTNEALPNTIPGLAAKGLFGATQSEGDTPAEFKAFQQFLTNAPSDVKSFLKKRFSKDKSSKWGRGESGGASGGWTPERQK